MHHTSTHVITRDHSLESVLLFNAVTATLGGFGLIFGFIAPPLEWLNHTIFTSYIVPGIILAGVVGGSATVAFLAEFHHRYYAPLAACISGIIMCGWIINEVALIQRTHWLQGLYFLLGAAIVSLSYTTAKEFLIIRKNYFL